MMLLKWAQLLVGYRPELGSVPKVHSANGNKWCNCLDNIIPSAIIAFCCQNMSARLPALIQQVIIISSSIIIVWCGHATRTAHQANIIAWLLTLPAAPQVASDIRPCICECVCEPLNPRTQFSKTNWYNWPLCKRRTSFCGRRIKLCVCWARISAWKWNLDLSSFDSKPLVWSALICVPS